MFMLSDLELQMCTAEGDSCETPWDACCESPDKIVAHAITVQVKDGSGQIIKEDLRGFAGIDRLAKVTVRGTIAEHNDQVLVLDATSIYVHPEDS
jgi:hypothetical protein